MITYNQTNDIVNKWPALVVCGKSVTKEQAAEILIRTDGSLPNFHYSSNDKPFECELMKLFGMPDKEEDLKNFQECWAREDELRARLNKLDLQYLCNSQIVSSYIGGPHGWCNWEGSIFTNTYNIGKWPSVEEVAEEWDAIATAFPFLDLTCQLYSKEQCEEDGEPNIEFRVVDGNVTVQNPAATIAPAVNDMTKNILDLGNPYRERGIMFENLKEKLENLYGEIPQLSYD